MNTHHILFPSFTKWYRSFSPILRNTPIPIRIAIFPSLLIIAAFPIALIALFSTTSIEPRAASNSITSPLTSHPQEVIHQTVNLNNSTGRSPSFITTSLPAAIRGELYLTSIIAVDSDISDTLEMSVSDLPSGINLESCRPSQMLNNQRVLSCSLSGTPTAPADIYVVTIQVTDSTHATASLTLPLEINK